MATPIPGNQAEFTPWELAAASGGELTRIPAEMPRARGVSTDSRAVVPGHAFVALRGDTFDGHAYLASAVERGAVVLVVERGRTAPPGDVAIVEVPDTLTAFGDIARAHVRRWRRHLGRSARAVAITGSAGKTTTKELLVAILSTLSPCHATCGNLNNRVGVPSVALGLGVEPFAVFEMGMSVPGEMASLMRVVGPDVGVLLNVGLAHAAGFGGSRSAIAREKGAIFEGLRPDGIAVVNVDDDAVRAQVLRTDAAVVGFGQGPSADVRLLSREPSVGGSRVTVGRQGERFELDLAIPGEAAALDLVAAIAAADAARGTRIAVDVIERSLRALTPPPGRARTLILEGDVWAIDDSYNANPASMRASLAMLAELRGAGRMRAVAVLGEMRELGPIADREHEALGDEIARRGIDLVIGSGGAIEVALRRAAAAGVRVIAAADADEAGRAVSAESRAGDVVLFKGSRAAAVERALARLLERYPLSQAKSRSNA
jgi:UDP-N-acetylmuramoyl-tripeptide--D-alanyl-D-alanine ligase